MVAIIPDLTGQPQANAYGIRCRPDQRWEAVLNGEVIAIRNTATDAGYALVGFREGDAELESLMIEDCIGLPAIEQDQIPYPNGAFLLLSGALSAGAIAGFCWLVWAIASHLLR